MAKPNDLKDRMVSAYIALDLSYRHLNSTSPMEQLEAYWYFKGAQANLYAAGAICEKRKDCGRTLAAIDSLRSAIDASADDMGAIFYSSKYEVFPVARLRAQFNEAIIGFRVIVREEIDALAHEGIV